MRSKKFLIVVAFAVLAIAVVVTTAVATPLPNGTMLSIDQGAGSAFNHPCDTGSCFSMEVNPGLQIWTNMGPGTDGGIIVGKDQAPGGQEGVGGGQNTNPGELTAAWNFFTNNGCNATKPFCGTSAGCVTTGASANLFDDTSCLGGPGCLGKTALGSWHVAWNSVAVPMGSALGCKALDTTKCQGVIEMTLNPSPAVTGSTYVLRHFWAVPNGDPSGFGNVPYSALLRGTVTLPVASSKIGVFSNGNWYLDANQNWAWDGTPTDIQGAFGLGIAGAIPVVGDWTGNGKTKVGVYVDGVWYLDMNGNGVWDGEGIDVRGVFGLGLPNAIPVTGDWNGDGITEIGIYSNGNWYLDKNRNWAWDGTPTDTYGSFGVGLPNPVPVTGDWNGDGTTEIGIYSNGNWYLDTNRSWAWDGTPTDTFGSFGVGLPNPVPVTGDWNGDGTTKIGIYSNGNWYLDTNKSWSWDGTPTDTFGSFGIGLPNPVPVVGKW